MLTASMLAVSMANKDWHFGFNYTNWPFKGGPPQSQNDIPGPRKIVVGGSETWQLNFNYTDWAIKHGPFYLNDTLGELDYFAIATCYILPCIVQVVKYIGQNHIFKPLVF